jgi:hypothetical protein
MSTIKTSYDSEIINATYDHDKIIVKHNRCTVHANSGFVTIEYEPWNNYYCTGSLHGAEGDTTYDLRRVFNGGCRSAVVVITDKSGQDTVLIPGSFTPQSTGFEAKKADNDSTLELSFHYQCNNEPCSLNISFYGFYGWNIHRTNPSTIELIMNERGQSFSPDSFLNHDEL